MNAGAEKANEAFDDIVFKDVACCSQAFATNGEARERRGLANLQGYSLVVQTGEFFFLGKDVWKVRQSRKKVFSVSRNEVAYKCVFSRKVCGTGVPRCFEGCAICERAMRWG